MTQLRDINNYAFEINNAKYNEIDTAKSEDYTKTEKLTYMSSNNLNKLNNLNIKK